MTAIAGEEIDLIRTSRSKRPWVAVLIVCLSAALNIYLAFKFPLAPDETYYWEWSRRPGWGYFDQGPMIAWWIRAGCGVFGDTQIGIRAGIILAFVLTQIFLYKLFRDLVGERASVYGLVLVSVTPIALVGGFVATYDPLQVLFWSAAMYFVCRAMIFESSWAWLGAGAAFGLGMLTKHTMSLFLVCVAFLFITNKANRKWLIHPWPYVAGLIALLIFLPSIHWQSTHEWMTFRHLLTLTGKGTDHPFPRRLMDFVGSQAGVLTPLLFFGFVSSLCWAVQRRKLADRRLSFLFWMSVPVLLFFLAMTSKSKVQANWAVCGWLTAPALYSFWALGESARASFRVKFFYAAIATCLLLSFLLCVPELRAVIGIRIPASWDSQVNKMYGGEELARAVEAQADQMLAAGQTRPVIGAATYDIASRLAFYVNGKPRTKCFYLGTRENSYVLWNDEAGLKPGGAAVLVDDFEFGDPRRPKFEGIFERVEPVAPGIDVYRRPVYEQPLHTYYLYRCYGYRPNPAVEIMRGG